MATPERSAVPSPERGGRDRLSPAQWAALLAAPVAWFVFTALAWALPAALCDGGGRVWLHLWAGASVLVGLAGVMLGARAARAGTTGGFTAVLGTLVSAVAVLALLFSWAFIATIGPCA